MKQRTTTNGIIVLTADEDMMLKNGETYSAEVWLGKNDSVENWAEVDYAEYEAWLAEQAAEMDVEDDGSAEVDDAVETPVYDSELEAAKAAKVAEIKAYDESDAVNEFYLQGVPMWLSKEERSGLRGRLDAEAENAVENTTLWYGTYSITIPVATAKALLSMIELYAAQCYDVTHTHMANVEALTSKEDVDAYDYTANYPTKLQLGL